ncbi:MAG: sugar phosphate isomerase/epimerase [Pedosphaera sp.]|nr:sugar phosphate isomerase/epimerase [Pedosphaera sp.]
MTRKRFIQSVGVAAAAATISPATMVRAAGKSSGATWPIGCFNRPWIADKKNWTYDTALDGIKAAGYKLTGMLTRTAKEPLIGSDATPEYLAELKKKIAARGLKVNLGALRTKNDLPLAGQIADVRKQIDNGKTVGVEFLLTFGVNKPEEYENYYKLMADAAAYAQERAMKLVLKPHGGGSGASEEILRCLAAVKHPNFKIWYDAGNIIFYTGKDPLEQLKPIAQHVTGFCAKDCDKQKGSVWLEFGKGAVDFPAVFGELKRAGFNGPVMVECCAQGETPEAVTESARKNREFLEKTFAAL